MSREICFMSASELTVRIRRGDISPVEAVDAFLARIDDRNAEMNAYVLVLHEQARETARRAEWALQSGGALGPLHGLPIAIKDLFDFKAGVRNTFGSKPFADYVPQENTTYIERLERAGAIILGKTNTPEFGHKGATDNFLFGPTSTPFAPGKNAGGSSGGSAAAVAAGLASIAQGSDGGGSIRIPASFCGVFGFKASYGRVAAADRPNAFLSHTPFVHSGPITRTVEDAALMLSVMADPHPRDPLSLPNDGADFLSSIRRSVQDWKIAYSPNFDVFPVDERVHDIIAEAVGVFSDLGARLEEVRLGIEHSQQELCALWIRQVGVNNAALVRTFKEEGTDLLGDHREDLSPGFLRQVEAGQALSAVEYKLDDLLRTEIFDAVQNVFDEYDLLLTPTLAVPPFDNADNGDTVGPAEINGEAVDPLLGWCLTYPINFTGHPAASIPAGFTSDGLPIGLQIIGRRFEDEMVFAASAAFERAKPWHDAYLSL